MTGSISGNSVSNGLNTSSNHSNMNQTLAQLQADKTLRVIEKLKMDRESRRKSQEEFKRRRADEQKDYEKQGKPGDVDFQRMIKQYRHQHLAAPSVQHASVGDLKINVVVRKRPISENEIRRKDYDSVTCHNPTVHVHYCKFKVDGITKYLDTTKFMMDHAFGEKSTNVEVYEHTAKPLIEFALNGGRATCFAYGQTGSGKTFTMAGIQSIAAKDIFISLKNEIYSKKNLGVYVSFFELYGGRCVDLLHEKNVCMVREDGKGRVHIEGLREVEVSNQQELLEIVQQGNSDRTTHATEMNNVSSRSHAICQIAFRKMNSYDREPFGKLSLIDLAGSERGQDTKTHNKQRRAESAEINKSLLALKECIRALDTSNQGNLNRHVPYRVSKLTMVLKDSFSSDAKTVMISCVSPAASSSDHTLNTLRYADRVKEKKAGSQSNSIAPVRSKSKQDKRRQTTAYVNRFDANDDFTTRDNSFNANSAQLADSRNSDPPISVKKPLRRQETELEDLDIEASSFDLNDDSPPAEFEDIIDDGDGFENEANYGNGALKRDIIEESKNDSSRSRGNIMSAKISLPEIQGNKKLKRVSHWGEPVNMIESERIPKEVSFNATPSEVEDLDSFADMSFKDLVSKLVDEEDDLLNTHMKLIEQNAVVLSEENELLQKVRAQNVVDYDIDAYTTKLDEILVARMARDKALHKKLTVFRKHLCMEDVRS